jgi:hypothetical protein
VEIESPVIVLHFHSDSSNTDWGWRLTATISQECDVPTWLFNLRECCNDLLISLCQSMLNNSFDLERDPENKTLSNPLVKYGVDEKCLWIIDKDHSREIDLDIEKLAVG